MSRGQLLAVCLTYPGSVGDDGPVCVPVVDLRKTPTHSSSASISSLFLSRWLRLFGDILNPRFKIPGAILVGTLSYWLKSENLKNLI